MSLYIEMSVRLRINRKKDNFLYAFLYICRSNSFVLEFLCFPYMFLITLSSFATYDCCHYGYRGKRDFLGP